MSLLNKILGRKPVDLSTRRQTLLRSGRITDGVILDSKPGTAAGEGVVFYLYTLNGVDFESSDILTEAQRHDPVKYAPGAKVGVRYDPRNQGNSIVE